MRTRASTLSVVGGLTVSALVALLLWWNPDQAQGPVPIVWDREACAECHMLVGEPRFAAQLQTDEGQVYNFDDPGCLLRLLAKQRLPARAIYFHDLKEERWLTHSQTGFVVSVPSPMGYGLGAVPRETPGALSFEQAKARVLSTEFKAVR